MRKKIPCFEVMRCVAATAVIAIHVLAPYRHKLGEIPLGEWIAAITVNSITRWAVPVFILITGALMLSDTRPFDTKRFLKRRLVKVLVPFVVWSVFYAFLSGWSLTGFDRTKVKQLLTDSASHATYYHLGFFYYFIPLYLMVPFFRAAVGRNNDMILLAFVAIWLPTTLLFLLRIDGPWTQRLWLYCGYLPLGYLLYQRVPLTRPFLAAFSVAGLGALATTAYVVIASSIAAEQYTIGRWFSYKTLNAVIAASMVFMLCRYFSGRLSGRATQVLGAISQHSLGIYILHPLFLWPMREFGWHEGHPAWVIPFWIMLSGGGAFAASWALSKSTKTAWLLP